MNNFRDSFLRLGILIFIFIFAGISSKVFAADLPYITYNGSHLYISPTDNSGGVVWDPSYPYVSISGVQSETDGAANTAAIVAAIGEGGYAAKVCSDLSLEGYNDWFLPAIDQLQAIHDNTVNVGDGFTPLVDTWYWSSTELSPEYSVHFSIGDNPPEDYARIVRFNLLGPSDIYTKNSMAVPVRCIRSVSAFDVTLGTITRASGDTTSTIEMDTNSAEEGNTVTLTVIPKNGMRLKAGTLVATYNDTQTATLTNVDENIFTFTMPAYAVTVSATFEIIPVHHSRVSSGSIPFIGTGNNPTSQLIDTNLSSPNISIENSKFTITKNLKYLMVDNDVKELQKFLNNNGFPVSLTGPGSSGNETNYFGDKTKQALIKFQVANNIKPSIGFFGPITRGVINNFLK